MYIYVCTYIMLNVCMYIYNTYTDEDRGDEAADGAPSADDTASSAGETRASDDTASADDDAS